MDKIHALMFFLECADEKIPHNVILLYHLKCLMEKLRQHDKVDRHILPPGRQNLLSGIGIQKQQFSLLQLHTHTTVDDMRRCTGAHIDNLDIVMRMFRKTHKSCMWAHINERASGKHLILVYYEISAGSVQTFIDPGLTI